MTGYFAFVTSVTGILLDGSRPPVFEQQPVRQFAAPIWGVGSRPGGLLKRISEPEPCGECRWGKCHELSAIHLWFDLHEFVVAIA